MTVVDQVAELARKYHEGQLRDNGKTPYITHPEAVVKRLRGWGVDEQNGEDDIISLAVAWGHDLFEDTKIDEREIEKLNPYGWKIAEGIRTLTFRASDGAKQLYIAGVAQHAEPRILLVKIADRLCNAMERLETDDRKAMSYIDAGKPLLENVGRLPERLRQIVEDDFRKCYREIESTYKEQELWEMMSDDMSWAGDE